MSDISFSKLFRIGCSDNSCMWGRPGGMGTNGGCRCPGFRREGTQTPEALQERMDLHRGVRLLREICELPHAEKALKKLVETVVDRYLNGPTKPEDS